VGNYANQVGRNTDVAAYPPNPYGLYDMAGNVMEWCHDWYNPAYYAGCESGVQNPLGPPDVATEAAQMRVLRGATYYHPLSFHTCSRRYGTSDTKGCFNFNGFRVVREEPEFAPARATASEKGTAVEMGEAEVRFAHQFRQQRLPVSFTLKGKLSAQLLRKWKVTRSEINLNDGRRKQTITAIDPKSGLELR
jgi:hypothetical protein